MDEITHVFKKSSGSGYGSLWEFKSNWPTITHDDDLTVAQELGKLYGEGDYFLVRDGDSSEFMTVVPAQTFVRANRDA